MSRNFGSAFELEYSDLSQLIDHEYTQTMFTFPIEEVELKLGKFESNTIISKTIQLMQEYYLRAASRFSIKREEREEISSQFREGFNRKLKETIEKEKNEILKEYEQKIKLQEDSYNQRITELEGTISLLQSGTSKQAQQTQEALKANLEVKEYLISQMKFDIDRYKNSIGESEKNIAKQQKTISELRGKLDKKTAKQKIAKEKNRELTTNIKSLRTELLETKRLLKCSTLSTENSQTNEGSQLQAGQIKQLEQRLRQMELEARNLGNKPSQFDALRSSQVEQQNVQLHEVIQQLKRKLVEVRNENNRIKAYATNIANDPNIKVDSVLVKSTGSSENIKQQKEEQLFKEFGELQELMVGGVVEVIKELENKVEALNLRVRKASELKMAF